MGKIEKIITACGVLTPAEYNKQKSFFDEKRDLFNDKVQNAIFDAVVANGKMEKGVRIERVSKFEYSLSNNKKLAAALGASVCAKPRTNSRTRKEIRELGI